MTDGDGLDPAATPRIDVRARALVVMATADEELTGGAALLQKVCRAAVSALSLRGGAIHLVTASGVAGVAASSDEPSSRVADLAFTTGEGPSVDAFTYHRPVLVNNLVNDAHRWPGFTNAAAESRILATFSFPLQIGGVTLGVLDLYADQPRLLDESELDLALAFGRLAAHAMLGGPSTAEDGTWEPLLDHRAEVYQAQGMIMVDLGIDLAEALVRMRAYAFSADLPLIELAHSIIRGFVLPAAASEDT